MIGPNIEREIVAWAEQTFPDATVETIHEHIDEEISELHEADFGQKDADAVAHEIGGLGLLLTHLASKHGLSFGRCVTREFAIVRDDTFERDDATGYAKRTHTPSSDDPLDAAADDGFPVALAEPWLREWADVDAESDAQMGDVARMLVRAMGEANRSDLVKLQRMIGAYYDSGSARLNTILDALQDGFEVERRRRRAKGQWS